MTRAPGIYSDIPDADYHGDLGSLSSSGARRLLPPSTPAAFRHEQLFGRPPKDEFDIGHAAHALLLGTGLDVVEVEFDTWNTKAAKEQRAEARTAGKVPLLSKQLAAVNEMVAVAKAIPEVVALLSGGRAEVSGYVMDPQTWVTMRARPDYLRETGERVVEMTDYKTTADASPFGFAKSAANFGYHCQEAWYRRVWAELGYRVDRFTFVAQEKTPPYLVSIHEFGTPDILAGDALNYRALRLFVECQDADVWPGYGHHVHQMQLPAWATRDAEVW